MRPYLENNCSKKGWGHGSSGEVLAYQLPGPSTTKKKKSIYKI
jgi:hypothetical protein